MKMPSSFFIPSYSAPRAVASAVQSMGRLREPRLLPLAVVIPHGQTHDGLFVRFGAPHNAGQISFVHHGNAVADAEDLFQLAADDDHRRAVGGQVIDQLVNFALRADVESARRVLEVET